MEQPEGFVVPGKDDQVCLLKKSLYGVKQAGRVWNTKINHILTTFGFCASTTDASVYHHPDGSIFVLKVDDDLICGESQTRMNKIIDYLNEHLEIT